MIVTAQIAVDDGRLRVGAHSKRSNDMAGSLRLRAVVHFRDTKTLEDVFMSRPRCRQACLHITVDAVGKARQRDAIHVPLGWIEGDAVVRVRQLLDQRGEADLARGLSAERLIKVLAA